MEKRLEKFRQNTQETIFLKNIREKKAFEATYNGEKKRGGFRQNTYKKMHSGQNTMAKNYILSENAIKKA